MSPQTPDVSFITAHCADAARHLMLGDLERALRTLDWAREELANVIRAAAAPPAERAPVWPDAMVTVHDATAAAAAPETIRTVEGLRALPHGTVLRDAQRLAWQVAAGTGLTLLLAGSNGHLDLTNDDHARGVLGYGPFTVLWRPEYEER